MKVPTTVDEIEQLIKLEIEESLHLEYKNSKALSLRHKKEITKDISSFANANGGIIIIWD